MEVVDCGGSSVPFALENRCARSARMAVMKNIGYVALAVVATSFTAPAHAQEVSIPDPGLNAAIREALQKPSGPLSEQDMLDLTNLSAGGREISSVKQLTTRSRVRRMCPALSTRRAVSTPMVADAGNTETPKTPEPRTCPSGFTGWLFP